MHHHLTKLSCVEESNESEDELVSIAVPNMNLTPSKIYLCVKLDLLCSSALIRKL